MSRWSVGGDVLLVHSPSYSRAEALRSLQYAIRTVSKVLSLPVPAKGVDLAMTRHFCQRGCVRLVRQVGRTNDEPPRPLPLETRFQPRQLVHEKYTHRGWKIGRLFACLWGTVMNAQSNWGLPSTLPIIPTMQSDAVSVQQACGTYQGC